MATEPPKWNIGQPGGPAGPFYSVVAQNGNVIAMQVTEEKYAQLIAAAPELLMALEVVSETIARWSNNGGPLDYSRTHISGSEWRELNELNVILENAIVGAGGDW
jgi:hypothetical protein